MNKFLTLILILVASISLFISCDETNKSDGPKPTPNSYFVFTLKNDNTYSVAVADASNIPESIVIPSNYNGNAVTEVKISAFFGCENLKSVFIPNSITVIGKNAFVNCCNLKSINVDSNNVKYKSLDGNLYSKDGQSLIQYAVGKNEIGFVIPDNVTSIGIAAFFNCGTLTKVTIPESVTEIQAMAFYGCNNLNSIAFKGTIAKWTVVRKGQYWKSGVSKSCKVYCTDGDVEI